MRLLQATFGVVSLSIGELYFIAPSLGLFFSTILFGVGLLFIGLAVVSSAVTPGLPGWAQGLKTAVGVIEIVFAFLVVLFPGFGLTFLWIFIGVSLLVGGFELLWMGPATPDLGASPQTASAGQA